MRKQTKIAALVSAAALLAIGASMTSFAVTGWNLCADGSYEYHDSDDIAITDEWRTGTSTRDGKTYYYYLDSDGKMATDKLIESGEHLYYVNADGERVANYWYKVENTDGVPVNEIEPEYLYYYFDKKGQAVKGVNQGAYKTNNDPNNTETAKYCFDDDYHMVSGWYTVDGATYYCNGETDGHMETGWAELEVPQSDADNGEPYEDDPTYAWYYFSDKGVRSGAGRSYLKYNGKSYWFEFDSNGRLLEEKFGEATNSNTNKKYYYIDGGYAANGWVEADYDNGADPSTNDKTYFYFENGAAFNFDGWDAKDSHTGIASGNNAVNYTSDKVVIEKWDEDNGGFKTVELDAKGNKIHDANEYAARVVAGKTYLFNDYGEYQTGVYRITGYVYRKGSSQPIGNGIYYFDMVSGGPKGSMKTKKDSVTNQYDETRNYLFKTDGQAVTSQISGGVLYNKNGLRVDATEGTWQIITIGETDYLDTLTSDKNSVADTTEKYEFQKGDKIVVNASGRVKESGTVVIDGTKYYIKNVSKGVKWDSVSTKYSKAKTTDSKTVAADVKGDTYVIVHAHSVD